MMLVVYLMFCAAAYGMLTLIHAENTDTCYGWMILFIVYFNLYDLASVVTATGCVNRCLHRYCIAPDCHDG